jgi:hypothetical protein
VTNDGGAAERTGAATADAPSPEAKPPKPAKPPVSPRRRLVRRIVGGVVLIAVVIVVWGGVTAIVARSRLEAVRTDLRALQSDSSVSQTTLERRLTRDLARARSALSLLHQPAPRLLAGIPLAGRSFVAERTVAEVGVAAVHAGLTVSRDTHELGQAGAVDLASLTSVRDDLARDAATLHPLLERLATLNTALTPPPVGDEVARAQHTLLGLDTELTRGVDLATALHGVLGGTRPRTVLVALENNAEERGTGGLISTYATGVAENGRLQLGHFRDVVTVSAQPGAIQRVPAPPAYVAHYGSFLANTTLWKNTNIDPDIPTSAQVLSEVAARTLPHRPDVIIFLDVPAMAGIVGQTSPVTVDGRVLKAGQLTQALLVDAYGGSGNTLRAQDARRHRLEAAASEAVGRLTHARASLGLIQTLARLASGRHVALWSADPAEEKDLVAAGVGGSVVTPDGDIAMVTATNLGDSVGHKGISGAGNKLDYYARRTVDVHVIVGKHIAFVTEKLTIHNTAPLGLKTYVEGPHHPGRLSEFVTIATPPAATLNGFQRGSVNQDVAIDSEHGYRRLSFPVTLDHGRSATWTLHYTIPVGADGYHLHLFPQPLAVPAVLRLTVVGRDGQQLDWLGSGLHVTSGQVVLRHNWGHSYSVAVRAHQRHGWQAFKHAVSDFWTKPV